MAIVYTHNSSDFTFYGHCDADWGGRERSDSKSTSGYIFFASNAPISWASKVQSAVALSSCEAKYISLAEASKQVAYFHHLLSSIGIPKYKIQLGNDNQSALTIASSHVHAFHPRLKHIKLKVHFIRDRIAKGKIRLFYVPTQEMRADMLTKPLARPKFEHLLQRSGLKLIK